MTHVRLTAWRHAEFGAGVHQGTGPDDSTLALREPVGTMRFGPERRELEWAAWLPPQTTPGFAFTSLTPSWNAATPGDSTLLVEARVSPDGVRWSRWLGLGVWAESDAVFRSTSVPGQHDPFAVVDTDQLVVPAGSGGSWTAYQLRVVLARVRGSTAAPSVRLLTAVAAGPPSPAQSAPGPASGIELAVPTYSQHVHRGDYPQWNSGDRAWCSPTSTAMVADFWARGPSGDDLAWVGDVPQPAVVHAARHVHDAAYGAGNWPFNTAYAASLGLTGFVTRLRSLAEAELFIAAGIPLVASVAFTEAELEGAGYSTSGHLLVIVGFDEQGNVVCNDPASHTAPDNEKVRVVYDRAQFERVWAAASGGLVYVVHPEAVQLPAVSDPAEPNW